LYIYIFFVFTTIWICTIWSSSFVLLFLFIFLWSLLFFLLLLFVGVIRSFSLLCYVYMCTSSVTHSLKYKVLGCVCESDIVVNVVVVVVNGSSESHSPVARP